MSNAREIAARWAQRVAAYGPEAKQTMREIGTLAIASARQHMTRDIYDKPVDRRQNGKPKWTRTGSLRRAELLEMTDGGLTFVLVNSQPYAEPRHEAGKPGRRNTTRPAPWRDEMIAELRQKVPELIHQMNIRALGGR